MNETDLSNKDISEDVQAEQARIQAQRAVIIANCDKQISHYEGRGRPDLLIGYLRRIKDRHRLTVEIIRVVEHFCALKRYSTARQAVSCELERVNHAELFLYLAKHTKSKADILMTRVAIQSARKDNEDATEMEVLGGCYVALFGLSTYQLDIVEAQNIAYQLEVDGHIYEASRLWETVSEAIGTQDAFRAAFRVTAEFDDPGERFRRFQEILETLERIVYPLEFPPYIIRCCRDLTDELIRADFFEAMSDSLRGVLLTSMYEHRIGLS
jgi:hypothetical protein